MRVSIAAKTNQWLTKKFKNSEKGTNSCTRSLHIRTHENSVAGVFLSDAYCKGVVRGQVECCNLRATYREDYAVAAECICTSSTVSFLGAQYLGLVDQRVEGRAKQARARACRLNKRHSRARRTLQSANVALLYALRPTHPDVWYLSPYELTMYWEIVPTRVPMSRNEADDPTARWDVTLLPGGYEKLCSTAESKIELVPGADFTLARMSCGKILVFDDTPETNQVRHARLLRRRPRAVCPHFGFCPTPRAQAQHREENARITAVYVRPWTMRSSVAEQHVPLATDMRVTSASAALAEWRNSFSGNAEPCREFPVRPSCSAGRPG